MEVDLLDPIRFRFECWSQGYPNPGEEGAATLTFRPVETDPSGIVFRMGLEAAGERIECLVRLYGFNLRRFIDDLAEIHRNMAGSARLYDQDDDVILCVTFLDDARGRIVIGGGLRNAVFFAESTCDERFVTGAFDAGIRTTFDGLISDQSYLAGLIGSLENVLRSTGVSTSNPMESP